MKLMRRCSKDLRMGPVLYNVFLDDVENGVNIYVDDKQLFEGSPSYS